LEKGDDVIGHVAKFGEIAARTSTTSSFLPIKKHSIKISWPVSFSYRVKPLLETIDVLKRLKISWPQGRESSSPSRPTTQNED